MRARRFFVEGIYDSGSAVDVPGGDAHKIRRVLRLRDGDEIEVIDSAGTAFAAEVAIEGRRVVARLGSALDSETFDSSVRFEIAQAIPKGQKMDYVIEKTTELGAEAVLPFRCERSVARAEAGKEARWRRLAEAAARQCGRRRIPAVHAMLPAFETLLDRFGDYDTVGFAWELAPRVPLRERLPPLLRDARRVLLVVGPEGGFTHDEGEAAQERGAELLWLGPRVLRTETAAVALLAVADAFAQGATSGRP